MMDQATTKPPLSKQVEECIDAHMSIEDGSEYVKVYPAGYSIIARLLRIRDQHSAPKIRLEAKRFLDAIDLNGGIGNAYRETYRFSMGNKIKEKIRRPHGVKGMRKLSLFEHTRISELASRNDLTEDETSEIKRIQASITDNKIASVDYDKLKIVSAKYHPVVRSGSNGKRHGWTKMDDRIQRDFKTLLGRPDVPDADKNAMAKIMDGIEDGRIRTLDYFDAAKILETNRASKKERAKRGTASKTFENAVFVACQACNNLDGMTVPILSKAIRIDLATKISESAMNLMRLQNELLQEEDNDDGRHQGSVRGRQESLSDVATSAAPVSGESCHEDS